MFRFFLTIDQIEGFSIGPIIMCEKYCTLSTASQSDSTKIVNRQCLSLPRNVRAPKRLLSRLVNPVTPAQARARIQFRSICHSRILPCHSRVGGNPVSVYPSFRACLPAVASREGGTRNPVLVDLSFPHSSLSFPRRRESSFGLSVIPTEANRRFAERGELKGSDTNGTVICKLLF